LEIRLSAMKSPKPWDNAPEWLREEMDEPDPAALARFLSGNPRWMELDRQRRLLQDGLGPGDEEAPVPDLWAAIRRHLEHPSKP